MARSRRPTVGGTRAPLRLDPRLRWSVYSAFAVMFFTGCAWLFADWQKRIAGDDVWQASAAWLLMLHGGGAMVTLLLLGALVPVHAHRAWRAKKNRISGSAMITLNALLIAS